MMGVSKDEVKLTDFTERDLDLLSDWLNQSHVKPWYPAPNEDLENARALCAQSMEGDQSAGQSLILLNHKPIGYIRWQLVPKTVLDEIGLRGIPHNSADVDLLIGERSQICRGIGARVLKEIEAKLRARGDVPAVGLTTSKENHYAHRAFEKSGFRIAAEYSPDGYGSCYLYFKRLIEA